MYQKILVPIDGSATSARGLEEAIQLAKLTGGRLRLIHVTDELSAGFAMECYAGTGDWLTIVRENGSKLLEVATATVKAAGVPVDSVLLDGLAATVQLLVTTEATSWGADLIVLGTHGRRGVGRAFLGSSAEQVLRCSPVPVLLVRAPELADTPVSAAAASQTVHLKLPSAALSIE
ncbi:nucleotide-binding universal stress UspA family protein [Variovorax sp. GrIS 2.14]|uniref:universal stress protein n=1 Tax=Variovorax sp. GrIS 2.14 TaxID=3071709 RepID=UPI0019B5FDBC|nr:universal stress protein [Variovorax sp.]